MVLILEFIIDRKLIKVDYFPIISDDKHNMKAVDDII
jgi:hypothetical protein